MLGPGGRLGRFIIRAEIGRGGMGTVYRAFDPECDREVAIKVLKEAAVGSPRRRARFEHEAEAAARLDHPGIAKIHELGRDGRRPFIVMQLVEGETLAMRLRHGPLPAGELVRIVGGVAVALDHVHARGLVHRDVKPANVIVGADGRPVLTDFGLVLDTDRERAERLTSTGELVGTLAYMAPEQLGSGASAVSAATDVHALGVLLYQGLCGRCPYAGSSSAAVALKILSAEPSPPRSVVPEIDPDLERIVLRCLAKRPEDRYASAGELADALRRWTRGEAARDAPDAARAAPIAVAALAVALGAVALAWASGRGAPQTPPGPRSAESGGETRPILAAAEPPAAPGSALARVLTGGGRPAVSAAELDAAVDEVVAAFDERGEAPDATDWPLALELHWRERLGEAIELADVERMRRMGRVHVRAFAEPAVDQLPLVEVIGPAQRLIARVEGLVATGLGSPAEVEAALLAMALLEGVGAPAVMDWNLREQWRSLDVGWLRTLLAAELARAAPVRDPALVLVLARCIVNRGVARDGAADGAEALGWVAAALETGVDGRWLRHTAADLLWEAGRRRDALGHAQRAVAFDADRPERGRWPVAPKTVCMLLVELAEQGETDPPDPARLRPLAAEAGRLQEAIRPTRELYWGHGLADPWVLSDDYEVATAQLRAAEATIRLGPPDCCGDAAARSEDLLAGALALSEQYDDQVAEVLRARARHAAAHGRLEEARAALDAALDRLARHLENVEVERSWPLELRADILFDRLALQLARGDAAAALADAQAAEAAFRDSMTRVRDVEDWRRGRLIEIMEARRSLLERLGRAEEARLARIEIERLGGASRARDADGD